MPDFRRLLKFIVKRWPAVLNAVAVSPSVLTTFAILSTSALLPTSTVLGASSISASSNLLANVALAQGNELSPESTLEEQMEGELDDPIADDFESEGENTIESTLEGTADKRSGKNKKRKALSGSTPGKADENDDSVTSESPPVAESPQPGAAEDGFPAEPNPGAPLPPVVSEKPLKIDDQGVYHYETKIETPKFSGRQEMPAPKSISPSGEFFYEKNENSLLGALGSTFETTPDAKSGIKSDAKMNAKGERFYEVQASPQSGSASFRIGFVSPPKIINPETGSTFGDVYTPDTIPVLLGDYEWGLNSSLGRAGIKFGSGLFASNGSGQFKTPNASRRSDDLPSEQFTFVMFPNQLTLIYRFQYADSQIVVPYIEGGAGYFTFAELRDDNKNSVFGGAAVTVAAGGLNIQMDWIDRKASQTLDADYGVNHVWLTTEVRAIVGLNESIDFSATLFNAGLLFDF